MNDPRKLSGYVEPPLSDARLDAQWSRIGERLPAPRRRFDLRLAALPALAIAAAFAFFWLRPDATRKSAWEGSMVRSDDSPVEMTLAEGSRVELSPRSQVRISRSPATGGERVYVEVDEGAVEVHRHDVEASTVRLVQGEHWSTFVAYEKRAPAPQEVARSKPVIEDKREPSFDPDEGETGADLAVESGDGARKPRAARRAGVSSDSAATDLFDRANVARRAGLLRDAAGLYADVVQRFPRDRSAALAAFELGRIRMDGLSDPRGAVQAFERALTLDEHRAFAEDALARLALAHAALGESAECLRAKGRYLSRYPQGVHVRILNQRCPGP